MKKYLKILFRRLGIYGSAKLLYYWFLRFASLSHEKEFHHIPNIRKFKNIIDVGANVGQSSLYFLTKYKESKIFAFEPNPSCKKELNYILKKNPCRFRYKICGLGHSNKTLYFYVPKLNDGIQLLQEGSFDIKAFRTQVTKTRISEQFCLVKRKIPVLKLDHFQLKCDLLKIDVQGFELNVLKGAQKTINNNKPIIFLENDKANEKDINIFLAKLNYKKIKLKNNSIYYI